MSTDTLTAPEAVVGAEADAAARAATKAANKAYEAASVAKLAEKRAAKKAAEARAAEKLADRKTRKARRIRNRKSKGSWAKRAGRAIRIKFRKGWRKLKSVLKMLVDKARAGARKAKALAIRAWDKAKKLAAKAKDLAWAAASKVRAWAVAGAGYVKSAAVSSWSWLKDATAGAWVFTAPARRWIATPFRLAAGATVGISTWLVLGSAMLVIGIPWVAWLLVSGKRVTVKKSAIRKDQRRLTMYKRVAKKSNGVAKTARKDVAAQKKATAASMKTAAESQKTAAASQKRADKLERKLEQAKKRNGVPESLTQGDTIVLAEPVYTPAQIGVLTDRIAQLEKLIDAAEKDKNLFSETSGRVHLVRERLTGSKESVTRIANKHRNELQDEKTVEWYRNHYTFTAVKRGVKLEDGNLKNLLSNAEKLLEEIAKANGTDEPAA